MEKLCILITALAGLLSIGPMSEAVDIEELKARLTAMEASQESLKDMMDALKEEHGSDVSDVTQFCQDLRARVEEQRQLLERLQEALEGRSTARPLTTEPTTPLSFENCGPCSPDNYTVIDDPRRVIAGVYSGYEDMCDDEIHPGWYRFLLNGENAIIPTTCVPENNCHTDAPTWLDLQGQSLPPIGQQVEARACSHWASDCCNWQAPLTILNCGPYYVYKVEPLPTCDLSLCVESQG